MKDKQKIRDIIEKALAVLLAIGIWQVGAMALGKDILLVSPIATAQRLFELVFEPGFWGAVSFSFFRIVAGFILSVVVGIFLAAISSRFHIVEVILWPFITVIKSTPVASFIILCLIWLSSANLSVFIAFLMVLPIVYTNVLQGIKTTDKSLLEMAKVFRVKPHKTLMFIYLPHLKPFIISACSVSLGLSWKAGIAAEVIGIPTGSIGEKLYQAKVYLSTPDLFAWTVVIIVISIIFEKLFTIALKKIFGRLEASK